MLAALAPSNFIRRGTGPCRPRPLHMRPLPAALVRGRWPLTSAQADPDSEIDVRRAALLGAALLSAVLAALLTGPLPAAVGAVLISAPILGAVIGRRSA